MRGPLAAAVLQAVTRPQTVKEQCVEVIRRAGYDFITACEMYEKIKAEFMSSPDKRKTYHIKQGGSFTLQKAS